MSCNETITEEDLIYEPSLDASIEHIWGFVLSGAMIPIAQRETRTRPIRDGLSYSTNGYHDAGISDREMKLATRGETGDGSTRDKKYKFYPKVMWTA